MLGRATAVSTETSGAGTSPGKLIYDAGTPHARILYLFNLCAGYTAGWLAHLNTWSAVGLHSEQGIDRMARPALGFHGTVLARVLVRVPGDCKRRTPDKAQPHPCHMQDGSGDANWGAGNWAPEPLYGASGLRGVTTHFQVQK